MRWLHRVIVPPVCCALLGVLHPGAASAEPDPRTAVTTSLTCTVVPVVAGFLVGGGGGGDERVYIGASLIAGGVYLGPATGYWYGGIAGRGFAGIGYRLMLTTVPLIGSAMTMTEAESGGPAGGEALIWVGCALIAAHAGYDIATVGGKVRRYNARRAFSLAPWRSSEGAPGLALRVAF